MKRFTGVRNTDVTGVSGTGTVFEGVEFTDGTAVIHWVGDWPTTTVHSCGVDSVVHIHGHDGATEIEWLDSDNEDDGNDVPTSEPEPPDRTVVVRTGIVYERDDLSAEGDPRKRWFAPGTTGAWTWEHITSAKSAKPVTILGNLDDLP